MTRLDREARVAIEALVSRGTSNAAVARLLGVSEGAVRYHVGRLSAGAVDGRGGKAFKATRFEAAIEHWREAQQDDALNLAALHAWLVTEHGYDGSLRSVQRFWAKHHPAPAIRARRRVETPPGAQAQADWAHFADVIVGGEARSLLAFKMVLSHSRKDAIVWSEGKDMLAWLGCHTEAFRRLGGVPATVRIDNEKTAVSKGAGAWGVINPSYRRYATTLRFHVDACPPRQPQCKGKIERRVRDPTPRPRSSRAALVRSGAVAALDGCAAGGPVGAADLPGHRPDSGAELGGGVRQADAAAGDPAGAVRRRRRAPGWNRRPGRVRGTPIQRALRPYRGPGRGAWLRRDGTGAQGLSGDRHA